MIPKFRARHRELNMMFEVKSLVFTLNLATIASKNDLVPSRTCSFDDIILMQSTGLKDKNGNEIFEDDIVRITLIDGFSYVVLENCVVKYKLGAFYILNGLGEYLISDFRIDDIEVVSNIYECTEDEAKEYQQFQWVALEHYINRDGA